MMLMAAVAFGLFVWFVGPTMGWMREEGLVLSGIAFAGTGALLTARRRK